ncbi:MAG TPA: hypothetical protein VFZ65_00070 [Planctomycetota bacterium]|nr:hypothetical protein [Planctomycetota bacterium]
MRSLICSLCALVLATTSRCQQEPQPTRAERPAAAKAPFVFEAGEIDLRTLIERCGTFLQRNILVDDVELMAATDGRGGAGRRQGARVVKAPAPAEAEAAAAGPVVCLQLPVVTDRDGCEELLSSLLWMKGLALVPLDEQKAVYEVLAINGQRQREIPMRAAPRTPEQVLARPGLRQFVTVVYRPQHIDATVATNALRPFFANSGTQGVASLMIGNVGNSSSLIVSGPQDMVASALRVVQAADVAAPAQGNTDLEARVDALGKQNEQLLRRIAALEQKSGKQGG